MATSGKFAARTGKPAVYEHKFSTVIGLRLGSVLGLGFREKVRI